MVNESIEMSLSANCEHYNHNRVSVPLTTTASVRAGRYPKTEYILYSELEVGSLGLTEAQGSQSRAPPSIHSSNLVGRKTSTDKHFIDLQIPTQSETWMVLPKEN
jgi:hypothetical protein